MVRSLKVSLVSPTYFSDDSVLGGGERYVHELAKALSKRVEVDLISFGSVSKRTRLSDSLVMEIFRSLHVPRDNISNPINARFLWRLLNAEIVHCAQPSTLVSNFAITWSWLARRRIYATDLGGGGISFRQFARLDRFVTTFLAISKFAARGYPAERLKVIYGGVDPSQFFPRSKDKDVYFLYVGRVLPHKGVNYLIEALPKGASLKIVGTKSHRGYAKLLAKLAKDKDVQFVNVPSSDNLIDSNTQLASIYSRALATVLPSVYTDVYGQFGQVSELLGLVLLESQACGTPVICTAVGGMPEVVEAGETGFIVPPNDPCAIRETLQYFLDNRNEANHMGKEGIRNVRRNFTWDSVAQRCLQAYREM